MKLEDVIQSSKFRDNRAKAVINILYTGYWLKTQVNNSLKPLNMTQEQFNVLRILNGKHPEKMNVKEIASRCIAKSANVPRIVDRLYAKNLIKRVVSRQDKRETLISITEKGMEQLATARAMVDGMEKDAFGLTEDESHQLHELLEKARLID